MMDDLELLRAYAVDGSDDAFRTVLERHVGLVYLAALPPVRNPHLAGEIHLEMGNQQFAEADFGKAPELERKPK